MRGISSGDAATASPAATACAVRARSARASALPPPLIGGPEPPRAPPPFGAPPFGWFFDPLISALDHFARHFRNAHFPAVVQHPESDLGRLFTAWIDQHQVRQMDGGFLLADTARFLHA